LCAATVILSNPGPHVLWFGACRRTKRLRRFVMLRISADGSSAVLVRHGLQLCQSDMVEWRRFKLRPDIRQEPLHHTVFWHANVDWDRVVGWPDDGICAGQSRAVSSNNGAKGGIVRPFILRDEQRLCREDIRGSRKSWKPARRQHGEQVG
jgi:hypothetical protein